MTHIFSKYINENKFLLLSGLGLLLLSLFQPLNSYMLPLVVGMIYIYLVLNLVIEESLFLITTTFLSTPLLDSREISELVCSASSQAQLFSNRRSSR